jgi:hypothetical protein
MSVKTPTKLSVKHVLVYSHQAMVAFPILPYVVTGVDVDARHVQQRQIAGVSVLYT